MSKQRREHRIAVGWQKIYKHDRRRVMATEYRSDRRRRRIINEYFNHRCAYQRTYWWFAINFVDYKYPSFRRASYNPETCSVLNRKRWK